MFTCYSLSLKIDYSQYIRMVVIENLIDQEHLAYIQLI